MSALPSGWGQGLFGLVNECLVPPSPRWRDEGRRVPYPLCFSALWLTFSTACWFWLGRSEISQELLLRCLERFTSHGAAARRRLREARNTVAVHLALTELRASKASTSPPPSPRAPPSARCACGPASDLRSVATCEVFLEASKFLKASRNRAVGFVHAVLATVLAAFCVLADSTLRDDVVHGVSSVYTLTGEFPGWLALCWREAGCVWEFCFVCVRNAPFFSGLSSGGYFLWDIGVVLRNWGADSAEWFLHGVISFVSVCSPFVFPSSQPMAFFAAALLLLEASTPFLALRFFLLKAGAADSRSCRLVSALFALTFVGVRLGFGCLWLFPEIWRILQHDPRLSEIGAARRGFYFAAMPLFAALQIFWAAKLTRLALKGPPPAKDAKKSL